MSIVIRLAAESDGAAVAEIYEPAVVDAAISFELAPPDASAMARRISSTLVQTPWIVCAAGAELLGYAYATTFRPRPAYQWTVEVSAYVRSTVHRCGVGRSLYTSLFEVLRIQGFRNALAVLTLPNPASEGLHRAMGFKSVGVFRNVGYKLGAWHDVAWMELPLLVPIVDPPAPIPLAAVQTSALTAALNAGSLLVKEAR